MFDQETALEAVRRIQNRIQEFDHDRQDPTEVLEVVGEDPPAPVEVPAVNVTAVTKSNLWHHPDAHPVVLDLVLFRHYGPEFLTWEAGTLRSTIPEDFHTSSLSELNLAKIQAVRALHLVDTYWEDWEVFLWCTMALNSVFPDFSTLQAPTAAQCLVSVDTASHLRDDMPWSDEVKAFIETSFRHDGLLVRIDPINFITMQRDPELADFKLIENRWPKVRDTHRAPTGETPEDEQLRRMLASHDYLQESRARLRHQLGLVAHV
jgi:hypothetical protein